MEEEPKIHADNYIQSQFNIFSIVNNGCSGKKEKKETPVVDALDMEFEEVCDDITNIFANEKCGLTSPGDMWLLMVAAEARKIKFDTLPAFIDWAFEQFEIPFEKEECKKKLQARMRNQPWSAIKNQHEMIEFIKKYRSYENVRISDTKKANEIYAVLDDF